MKYFKEKNIRVRNMDDGGRQVDLNKFEDFTKIGRQRAKVELSDEDMEDED